MATDISVPSVNKTLVLVIVSAGVGQGASGWGITPGGKLKKIPDNNPQLRHAAASALSLAAAEQAGATAPMKELSRVAESELVKAAAGISAAIH